MGFGAFMKGFKGGHEWAESAQERARQRDLRTGVAEAWQDSQVEQAIPTEQSVMLEQQTKEFEDTSGALPEQEVQAQESAKKTISATDWDGYEDRLAKTLLANGELEAYDKAKTLASELRRDRFNETFKGAMMAKRAGNREDMVAKLNQLGQYMPGYDHLEFDIDESMETPKVKGMDGKWTEVNDDWLMGTYAASQDPEKWFTITEAVRESQHKRAMRPTEVEGATLENRGKRSDLRVAEATEQARISTTESEAIKKGEEARVAAQKADLEVAQLADNLENGPVSRDYERAGTLLRLAQTDYQKAKAKAEATGGKLDEKDMMAREKAARGLVKEYQTLLTKSAELGNPEMMQEVQKLSGLDADMVDQMMTGNVLQLSEYAAAIAMDMPPGEANISQAMIIGLQQMALEKYYVGQGGQVEAQVNDETGEIRFMVQHNEGPPEILSRNQAALAMDELKQERAGGIPERGQSGRNRTRG